MAFLRTLLLYTISFSASLMWAAPPAAPTGFVWQKNDTFSDEFEGDRLDSSKWHDHQPFWKGRPPAKFVPEAVSVKDGLLRIRNSVLTPAQGEFTIAGGAVVSKSVEAHYGYYEVRMKASQIPMSSTFWLLNRPKREGDYQLWQELDVQEAVGGAKDVPSFRDHMHSNAHVWRLDGDEALADSMPSKSPLEQPVSDVFHTYGVWWVDANTMHFYHNDIFQHTIKPSTRLKAQPFDRPMMVTMVTETYDWETPPTLEELNNDAINTTYYDWTRAYELVKYDPPKPGTVHLQIDESIPPLSFAASELRSALKRAGYRVTKQQQAQQRISIEVVEQPVSKGYQVAADESSYRVTGASAREAMYGGLELAEWLDLGRPIWLKGTRLQEPYLQKRGLKFNIPLDARTPSYDDSGDAAQRNILEMWNMDFWTAYLDDMARYRYNALTLWNPHPFPSMVKMPDYPRVALDDVCVTTLKPTGKENEWGEPQLVAENVMTHLRVAKRISIDDKIAFWKQVMQHATNRGIDLYFITWNICPNSVARAVKPDYRTYGINVAEEKPGKHGVTHQIDNPKTIQYVRDSVKAFLLTYPQVKGIGVTAGEHMPKDWENNREQWLWDTYGEGILDAKREQPERIVEFIHRVWYSDLDQIMAFWGKYPDPFSLSFKYAKARLYSSPNIPFADKQIEQMKPLGLKSWWNLRNDDIYVYRWGDPDYVRDFLKHFQRDQTEGYHMGSDGYVWGREFVSRQPKSPQRELEISKHWYNFMMWGRLGYDPNLDRHFFESKLAERYPKADAKQLYATWQVASKIVPQVNRFYWQNWDHMWSVECSLGHVEGFHEVTKFVDNPTMEGSGILNVRNYVKATLANNKVTKITPPQVADQLDKFAQAAIQGADQLEKGAPNRDLAATLVDIRAMAWLGRHYADKIRAAVSLGFLQETGNETYRTQGIQHMTASYQDCMQYAKLSLTHYHEQMLARPGPLSWTQMTQSVKADIELIKSWSEQP